jgi:protein-tyrosine phosphatase
MSGGTIIVPGDEEHSEYYFDLLQLNGRPMLSWGAHGSHRHAKRAGAQIVMLCAEELQSPTARGLHVLRCPMDDDADLVNSKSFRDKVRAAAGQIAQQIQSGRHVLVTCRMGWNRSSLVTAAAAHMLTQKSGKSLVRQMKRLNPNAFGNLGFRAWVERWRS